MSLAHTALNGVSSTPQSSGNPTEEDAEREPEGMEDTRRTWPSTSTEKSSYELTETKAANTGHAQVSPGSLSIFYRLGLVFYSVYFQVYSENF